MVMMIALLSLAAQAASDEEQVYMFSCASKQELEKYAASLGMVITAEELAIISNERLDILDVLKTGNAGLQRVKAKGQFQALTVCGSIDISKTKIKADGCYDLRINQAIKDNGGIKVCSDFLKNPR